VGMALDEAGVANAHELGLFPQLGQGPGPHVAHARPQAAHQLEDIVGQRPLVGHLALDALRYVLAVPLARAIPVALAAAALFGGILPAAAGWTTGYFATVATVMAIRPLNLMKK